MMPDTSDSSPPREENVRERAWCLYFDTAIISSEILQQHLCCMGISLHTKIDQDAGETA